MASEDLEYSAQVICSISMILSWFYVQIFSSFVFNRNVSYAQIQIKRSVNTDIKAIKIQSKHFSQFQSWHSYCVLHL